MFSPEVEIRGYGIFDPTTGLWIGRLGSWHKKPRIFPNLSALHNHLGSWIHMNYNDDEISFWENLPYPETAIIYDIATKETYPIMDRMKELLIARLKKKIAYYNKFSRYAYKKESFERQLKILESN